MKLVFAQLQPPYLTIIVTLVISNSVHYVDLTIFAILAIHLLSQFLVDLAAGALKVLLLKVVVVFVILVQFNLVALV